LQSLKGPIEQDTEVETDEPGTCCHVDIVVKTICELHNIIIDKEGID